MHLVDDGKRVLARNFINNLKFLDARHYYPNIHMHTTQCTKMKFSITDFFSKSDQIRRKLRIWSHLRKKFLMENFIFCVVITL